ncbi:hypothetical protein [Halobaculum sp. EA56]|uniref:hypothetical protein n=1 Tax=Halobaculum sp. EA56 TaxID=3421648 RepID=UPI003EC136F3
MSRSGSQMLGLLHKLHAEGCDGQEYSTCRPVVESTDATVPSEKIQVVFMAWCGECGAADYEVV